MKSQELNPTIVDKKGDELLLSGSSLIELIQSVLSKGASFRFCARGLSMHPFIRHDDIVTIAPFHNTSPRPGDVVAFSSPKTNKLIIHRIVKRRGDCFLIKGDNLTNFDGFIPRSNILGRITKVERKGKTVILGLGIERFLISLLSRRGSIYSLFLPFWKLIRLFKKLRKSNNE